ncbi:MAG: hypothetical protein ACTTGX_05435 [Candidatus Cryptobacteroides sp.]
MPELKDKIKIFIIIISSFIAFSCENIKGIRITSLEAESFSLRGFTSFDLNLKLGVHNPASDFLLQDIKGQLKYEEDPVADFLAKEILIEKKSDKIYILPCTVKIKKDAPIFKLITMLTTGDIKGFTADIEVKAKQKNGFSKRLKFSDVALEQLLENNAYAVPSEITK